MKNKNKKKNNNKGEEKEEKKKKEGMGVGKEEPIKKNQSRDQSCDDFFSPSVPPILSLI